MRTSTVIKVCLVAGSLCVTAWRLPDLLERLNKASTSSGPLAPLAALAGSGDSGSIESARAAALLASLGGNAASASSASEPVAKSAPAPDTGQMVIFGAGTMSAEQRERLLRQAAAGAPIRALSPRTAPPKNPTPRDAAQAPAALTPEQELQAAQRQLKILLGGVQPN